MSRERVLILLFLSSCCATSIFGQQSHYVNIAPGKTYDQISTHNRQGPSGNAANGNTSGDYSSVNCIHTNASGTFPDPRDEFHWWQVDLGKAYPVYNMVLWARELYKRRLYPLTITVDDRQCVSETPEPSTREHTVTCARIMYGQVVRLTLTRTDQMLNLCELQIFVCEEGYHGADCSLPCDPGCEGGCYRDSGNCTNCKVGSWGPYECQQSCSPHCSTGVCQRANGHCSGCKTGFHGDKCDTPCSSIHSRCSQCTQNGACTACSGDFLPPACTDCARGYYKNNGRCQQCNSNCKNQQCDRDTGRCHECQTGYYGAQCGATCSSKTQRCTQCNRQNGACTACGGHFLHPQCTDCVPGYYKINGRCQQCNPNCKNRQCNPDTGKCNDCPDGRHGTFCTRFCSPGCGRCDQDSGTCQACATNSNLQFPGCTECKDGYYKQTAPNCIRCPGTCDNNSPCNKTTGHCQQCPPGKKGDICDQACDGGQYGPSRCSLSCGQCQNGAQCHPVTGHCLGCQLGFYPPLCRETCTNNTYGQNCSESCGQCQGGQPCDTDTGNCTSGCQPGYIGQLCKTECESGFYGEGCNQTCGHCEVNTTCHHQEGHCMEGCAPGFSGTLCDRLVEDPPEPSAVIVGSVIGVLVAVIVAVVIGVFVMRWRKRKFNSESVQGDDAVIYNNISQESSNRKGLNGSSAKSAGKGDSESETSSKATVATKTTEPPTSDLAIYENVTIPRQNSKPSATQNGDQKPKTSSEKKKPPIAAKPTKGRESTTGKVTLSEPLTDDEGEDFKVSDAAYVDEGLYANIRPTGIRVNKLQETVVERLHDGSLDEEFLRLHPKKEFATKNGERKENYYKNRFNSILPYDKNRVELQQVDGDDASDYVNASFVRGNKKERAYIAAQGPRDNTVDEFWRMVWQEGVTDIVMLTNIKEANKPKCYEYWPAKGERLTTGHMEVTGVEEETRAHFVIRTFDLKQTKGSTTRRVKQYHYQSWMDHEVPATTSLVSFWRYVRSRAPRTAEAPPLLVHCSAGVGRTGTFIALDILIDHAQQEAEVDIYKTVDKLRDDRCHMVQNKGQYSFLHEAVLEAYLSGDSRIQTSDMDTVLPHTVTHTTPQHRIDKEFETLCKMRNCLTTPTYTTANMKENRRKNRNPDSLPNDKHLVYLTKHVQGRNQYINAVYMATFLRQRGSIMTQLPLPDTLVDMWRLVDGCDVNTIVSIGDVDGKKGMCRYWPEKPESPLHTGPYTIGLQAVIKMGDNLSRYTLDLKTDKTSREVCVLHLAGWTGPVADNMADLIHLLTTLHTSQEDKGGYPVIVQCIDGASQSGVVCALWDVISRMTCDAELDVYMAVRQLHTVRPEALTSLEQYRYCYAVAQHFKNSQNIYANT